MKRGILLGLTLLALLIGVSCSSARKASVSQQRAGLLMLEGENIYKNKGQNLWPQTLPPLSS